MLRYIRDNYNQSATLIVDQIECINVSTATFRLQLSFAGSEVLHQIQNDITSSVQGLNIGIGILIICKQNCTGPSISDPGDDADADGDNYKIVDVMVIVAAVIVGFVLLILFTCCLIVIYKRYELACVHAYRY